MNHSITTRAMKQAIGIPKTPRSLKSPSYRACAMILFLAAGLSSCQSIVTDEKTRDYGWGLNPLLKAPKPQKIPTLAPAKAIGWPEGQSPVAAPGLKVNAFAQGLDHPRWLYELPNGDILVAETDAPEASAEGGLLAWFAKRVMRYSGSGFPSPDRISLLRDTNGDGTADLITPFATGLNSPFGMALVGDHLYIANTNAVIAFNYTQGATEVLGPSRFISALPANAPNSHWTKNLLPHPTEDWLFVAIGSNSNIGELGHAAEAGRAGIWTLNLKTGDLVPFATGLRNPVGMALHPETKELWTVVNERDLLGNELVPDYLARVREGEDFGWPTHYWGILRDERVPIQWRASASVEQGVKKPKADPDQKIPDFRVPDVALGAHTASLGLAFYSGESIPTLANHAIIGQRGSWNRKPRSGYEVISIPFSQNGEAMGPAKTLLSGFIDQKGQAKGRPVGVITTRSGAILVADDVGGSIWRMTNSPASETKEPQPSLRTP